MATIKILYDPVIFTGTLSGGSWVASLPLTNLKNQEPKKIARTTDALAASTQFMRDLGHPVPVSMFALINHNLSSSATIRWRVSNNSDLSSPLIDVTVNANAPNIIWGSLPWGAFPWTGFLEDEQPGGPSLIYVHPTTQYGQYRGINIADTGNADGYIQIGVSLAGQPFTPAINFIPGAGLGLVDPSKQTRAVGGALYTDVRPQWRTFTATLDFISQAEAVGAIARMRRLLGISGALLLVIDSDEADGVLAAGTIYGRLSSVTDPVRYARNTDTYVYSATIEIEELI